ncbi:TonB-dependent receptor [Altererythrobacter sp. Z27]|uniref:TonB-dependent receptor n=1 Tax=Altererythrobacter sp. Z27 TaxID=3461147 RepID=UPI004043F595
MQRKLATFAAGLLAGSFLTSPVLAQDAGSAAQAESEMDENVIIVTATLRASDVQDIPIAVTAVTPQELQRQGITNIQTLSTVAPSFNIQSSQTESQGTSIRIRGIGTTGNNIGLESAVGVFIDGVYQSRPGIALGELVDVQQVEILRGPQGTLFGRNTTAGAVVVRNNPPDLNEFGGFVQASYGNYDFMNVQGAINAPVGETLGVRLTGAYRKRDGFLIDASGNDVNDKDRYMIRGQALWEPTPDISLRIIGDYQKADELCCDAITLSPGANYTAPFVAAAYPNGFVAPFLPAATGQVSLPSIKKNQLFGNSEMFVNGNEQWGISGELSWDFGPAELTTLVAYRDFHAKSIQDDFQGVQVYSVAGVTEDNLPPTFDDIMTFTAEARLQGSAFDDVLDWLVGVYYADEKIVEEASLTLGPDFQAYVGQANFGSVLGALAPAYLGLVAQSGAYLNSVLAGSPNPGIFSTPISADNSYGYNHYEQKGESFSVFTHNIINITDTFNLTLGARYVDDRKDGSYDQLAASNPACLAGLTLAGTPQADAFAALQPILGSTVAGALALPALNGPAAFINCFPFAAPALGVSFLPKEFDLTFKDDEFIYTAQIGWEPNPDLLAYAGFTHGYKAGGFNLDSTAAASGGDPRFQSEEIDSYEVGLKATILNGRGRANFAIFYNELANFQVLEFTGTQFQTFNVDDVTAKGVEAELFAAWTPHLSNSFSVTYTDAKYGSNCDARYTAAGGPNPALELCGTSLTNAPKVVGVWGMTYDGPISSDTGWNLLANVNVRYETERRTSTKGLLSSGGVITGPVAFDMQDANVKVNARLGISSPDKSFAIELWGRNIFNEITRGITFNTPLTGSGLATGRSAFIDDPRTYGITARKRF